jgi:uncharacterized protein (DUF983 family)
MRSDTTVMTGWAQCLTRGFGRTCPRCGRGRLFRRYLALREGCPACGLAFDSIRADDAPAYFTIFIVGHIVVSLYLALQNSLPHEPWVQATIWLPTTTILCLLLLPPIKGATMAVIFKTRAG